MLKISAAAAAAAAVRRRLKTYILRFLSKQKKDRKREIQLAKAKFCRSKEESSQQAEALLDLFKIR